MTGPLKGEERERLLDALYQKYGKAPGFNQRFTYNRKKYSWFFVVASAKWLKRALDIILGTVIFIFFLPGMALIALLIKVCDGGPVFYISSRVGKWGQEFRCPKFRTMKVDTEAFKNLLLEQNIHPDDITFKMKDDPRTSRFGSLLRKSSLDELPQLFNVIKGEMSLVGPRPPLPEEVARYTIEQRRRLDVTPGLTGIWQVSGRSDIPFSRQVQLDLEYIESQSFWLDLKILLKTIPAVLFGRGAY